MSERWNEIDDVDLLQLEAEMRVELGELREAATVYADRTWARGGTGLAAASAAPRRAWTAWAATAVAALALTVTGVGLAHHRKAAPEERAEGTQRVTVQSASAVSDEALLDQIQSDLASGVPAPMEPLQASDSRRSQSVVQR